MRVNSITGAVLTRLDVLSAFPTIEICTAYELDGKPLTSLPATAAVLERVTPIYEEVPGWQQDISGVRQFGDLPEAAQAYVKRIEELLGAPIEFVSVGPEREQAIMR